MAQVEPGREEPEDLRDQASRLWSHAMHEDDDFVQRGNFFLVAASYGC
jgi:hypothetical protein